MTFKLNQLPWVLLGVLLIVFLFREGCNKKEIEKLNANISNYQLKEQNLLDSIKNKNGQIVKLQEAIVFEGEKGKAELKRYSDSVFGLKKKYKETVAYYQNYIRTFLPDTIYVSYIDSIPQEIGKDTLEYITNSIRVPRTFEKDDPYFKIQGNVKKYGVDIISLSLPDTLSGRFVEKKQGLFKPNKIEYQTFNKNPYIRIDGSKSAVYSPKKKNLGWKILGIAVLSFFIGKTIP